MSAKGDAPVLLIILPRGESYRNFVYSEIIDKLGETTNLHVVAVIPNSELKTLIEKKAKFKQLSNYNFSYVFDLLHDIIDLAHNRYMWSEAAQVRWHMRDVEAIGVKNKFTRLLKKCFACILAGRIQLNILDRIAQFLSLRENAVKYWIAYFNDLKPRVVFNTSHSHARNAHAMIYAANALKIKTITFLFSWDNLTSQGRVIPRYNYYFAWNDKIKEDFYRIYPNIPNQNVFVSGTPQFIGHFQEEKHLTKLDLHAKLGLKSDEVYFLYSSGMSHHLPDEPYVVSRIGDIVKSIGPNYKLVVRTYAKDRFDVFEKLKIERPDIIIPEVRWEKNFQTPLIEDQVFFSSLLKHCIAGINVASTISLELCMFDKPAINVAYNPPGKDISPYNYTRFYSFDHYKPIVESGAVELAENEEQMLELLKTAIENPARRKKERAELIHSFFGNKLDERVTVEFVNLFKRLLKDA